MSRVMITGIDGYLGWPLAQHLAARGHIVGGVDNGLLRRWVHEMGSHSAIPISSYDDRRERIGMAWDYDLCEYTPTVAFLEHFHPDTIVHLGECPSAPYSMIDVKHAAAVQVNNVTSTLNILFAMRDYCPEAHLVKLGTMGEYGAPFGPIPEGWIDYYADRLPFPKRPGSWYHASKVHDSTNIEMACRLWGLRSTDIMQGVVYGTCIEAMGNDPVCYTRLDFDQAFGTVINRFVCQAIIGHPLTLYGAGHQKRGFLPLRDSIQCLTLAIEQPPKGGEYRVLNQFEEVYDLTELAVKVAGVGRKFGCRAVIRNMVNPRKEAENHSYNPERSKLQDMGYVPNGSIDAELSMMFADLIPHRGRILARRNILVPDIRWNGRLMRVAELPDLVAKQSG